MKSFIKRLTHVSLFVLIFFLVGCASMIPPERLPITTEKRDFIYDFKVPGKSKTELFNNARNYLATSYGNSKDVTRVEDEKEGTIIGKAVSEWKFSTNDWMIPHVPCYSRYNIFFVAKDEKARLQLSLLEGTVLPSCGWRLPPKQDYPQIVDQFNTIANDLKSALEGSSTIERLKNF
jgi:hypothetical protein